MLPCTGGNTAPLPLQPVPGGLLIPSLATGGLLGRALGLWVQRLATASGDGGIFAQCLVASQCVTPGVYAIVGAAAVLGGVTRMTVSLVAIVFEITGGLEYILPVMGAVMVSKWVGDALSPGVYDVAISIRDYPYLDSLEKAPIPPTPPESRGPAPALCAAHSPLMRRTARRRRRTRSHATSSLQGHRRPRRSASSTPRGRQPRSARCSRARAAAASPSCPRRAPRAWWGT